MCRKGFMFVAILLLGGSFVLAAEQPASTEASMSSQEQAKLRQGLQTLSEAFGVEQPKPAMPNAQPQNQQAQKQAKTPAELADKALDMVSNVTAQLSDQLQKMAPEVWRIMVTQQIANAIAEITFPLGLIVSALMFMWIGGKMWKYDKDQDYWVSYGIDGNPTNHCMWAVCMRFLPTVFCVIVGCNLMYHLSYSIRMLINPEYYAIRDLLTVLLHPSSVH